MSKKKKDNNIPQEPEFSQDHNYYEIKKDAVDRLVNASAETAPKVTEEEIVKYRGKKKFYIPNVVKVLLIKWWFAGAICFFFYFGLGTVIQDIDLLFVFAAAMGVLTDLLTNHLLRFIEKEPKENDKFMMVTVRKFYSIFLNLIYAFLVMYVVMYLYNLVDIIIVKLSASEEAVSAIGVEPVTFGLAYLAVDMVFILMKNTFVKIVDDAKAKSRK